MMRSLWTAASGMKAQQTNVDTIANNISNVNTVGYKTQTTQFKSLLYQTLATETTTANGEQKPSTAQVGLGTRVASLNSIFKQGAMLASESDSAFAIQGDGFFAVRNANNEILYTRNGNFNWSLQNPTTLQLSTQEGYAVLDQNGQPIILPAGVTSGQVEVSSTGQIGYRNQQGQLTMTAFTIGLTQFNNPTGLEKTGNSFYRVTAASGNPMPEFNNANLVKSSIVQGYLEGSNVQVADEMVNLIVAQRAYELNSKAITTSDTMLETANNLKR